ncbi:helix-turn-helix domain-containing protein [Lentimicrobium sp. S6]|uniref:helix-turn-helix domain-containing protein n=1 Tax=Lentimicrobium sp. S6 TaxID=2735872 RepID=UPI001554FD0C|nr:helix-turn-helix domain-containing protein [Lentimicrobium sp. S6]NPD47114.1 helix-turn-helix domain-containing protein [Lentimicrobium sp. S6]
MSNSILLEKVSFEELSEMISKKVKESLEAIHTKPITPKYFTRKETAEMLNISLPTLHTWTKQGIIAAYSIGTRVLYKEQAVLAALKEVETLKYRR